MYVHVYTIDTHICICFYTTSSKFKRTNPGFDKVGKIGPDGNPLVSHSLDLNDATITTIALYIKYT